MLGENLFWPIYMKNIIQMTDCETRIESVKCIRNNIIEIMQTMILHDVLWCS